MVTKLIYKINVLRRNREINRTLSCESLYSFWVLWTFIWRLSVNVSIFGIDVLVFLIIWVWLYLSLILDMSFFLYPGNQERLQKQWLNLRILSMRNLMNKSTNDLFFLKCLPLGLWLTLFSYCSISELFVMST